MNPSTALPESPLLEPATKKPRLNSSRCETCKKKLGLMEYKCKCEKLFCISHLQPQEHACTFDYKAEAQVALVKHLNSEPRPCCLEKI